MNQAKPTGKKCYPIDLAIRVEQFINRIALHVPDADTSIENRDATLEAIKLLKEIK